MAGSVGISAQGKFGIQSLKRGILILTVITLRDVLEVKVSPTAVFHFVRNSSSDIPLLYKYQTETKLTSNEEWFEGGKKKHRRDRPCIDTEYPTYHRFNVHLPPPAHIVDLSKPTHHLQCHLASHLVPEIKGTGQS
jgi:hypothetical protein